MLRRTTASVLTVVPGTLPKVNDGPDGGGEPESGKEGEGEDADALSPEVRG
jgi:hypothetical protein